MNTTKKESEKKVEKKVSKSTTKKPILELNRNLGMVILLLRTENKMTQEDLAKKAEITQRYLIDIEKGKRAVSIDVLDKIATVFHLKLSLLISKAEKFMMP